MKVEQIIDDLWSSKWRLAEDDQQQLKRESLNHQIETKEQDSRELQLFRDKYCP